MPPRNVRMWALSTCAWCKKTKRFLEEHQVPYSCTDVDLLPPEEKQAARDELSRFNPKRSYPTVLIDDQEVIRGYDVERLSSLLGLRGH
ncbi:MAG: glutaredoxin family protein [Polyangia bacterium]|nr:glutaredoxin family protein [Polyangia bacterium]